MVYNSMVNNGYLATRMVKTIMIRDADHDSRWLVGELMVDGCNPGHHQHRPQGMHSAAAIYLKKI